MFVLLASLLLSLRGCLQTRAALHAENLALRHQLLLLQREHQKPSPAIAILRPTRLGLWVWLSRVWSNWRSAVRTVKPETLSAWHRQGLSAVLEMEEQGSSWWTVCADDGRPKKMCKGTSRVTPKVADPRSVPVVANQCLPTASTTGPASTKPCRSPPEAKRTFVNAAKGCTHARIAHSNEKFSPYGVGREPTGNGRANLSCWQASHRVPQCVRITI